MRNDLGLVIFIDLYLHTFYVVRRSLRTISQHFHWSTLP